MARAALRVAAKPSAIRKSLPKSRRQFVSPAMPDFVPPQLAKLVSEPPGRGYVHEVKYDGYRVQARIEDGRAILRTRSGLDWTHKFPEIASALGGAEDCIIDGEICAVDKSDHPNFAALQQALSTGKTGGLIFYVFDMMYRDREDFRAWPLITRKATLKQIIEKLGERRIHYSEHQEVDGRELLAAACRMKLEGIVSKKSDAKYVSDDRGIWMKTKCRPRQELVIGGWEMNGARFKSLMLGARRAGKFTYVGTVGTGFNQRNLPPILERLRKLIADKTPFQVGSPKKNSEMHWVKPTLVCEVAFETWTRDGHIRQASFKALREDKKAADVVVEQPQDQD